MSETTWRQRAACRDQDPELFFATAGYSEQARRICAACPVRATCLLDAFETDDVAWGIRGGLTAPERRKARKRWLGGGRESDQRELAVIRRGFDLVALTAGEQARLHNRMVQDGTCLLWTGSVDIRGRGQFTLRRGDRRHYPPVHRVAFAQHHRRHPVGFVEQSCGNKLCCEPAHLLDDLMRVDLCGDSRTVRKAAA